MIEFAGAPVSTAVAILTPSPPSSAATSVCNKVGAVRALFPVRIADWVADPT